ncbi:MAG: phospholipase [Proteobacteria bacterium]|nr:MAG: phospholipase [Pseudomonadota bacterium]
MQEINVEARPVPVLWPREGPPPRTSDVLPFRQLDQWPPTEIHERLLEACASLDGVRVRQSRMASPRTCALCLPPGLAGGPPEAFIDPHEFCHLHPLPEGSIHLVLPPAMLESAMALGWAERHPISWAGILETLAMVYAPRNPRELEAVFGLIRISCEFARGVTAWKERASYVV